MSIDSARYIPILSVRPAEMNAVLELPEGDKDILLPAIQLRPWVNSHHFSNTIKKVEEVFGKERKWIGNLDCDYVCPEKKKDPETGEEKEARPAIAEFKELCSSENGFANWCQFVEDNENVIPTIRLEEASEFDAQLNRLAALERGLVIHCKEIKDIPTVSQISALRKASSNNTILFIIDCGDLPYRQDLNLIVAKWVDTMNNIASAIPNSYIAISSTSFPSDFSNGIPSQEIRERQLYDIAVATNINGAWNLIYSDRGSARLQVPRGGGGVPYPRIDYPTNSDWFFFRSDFQDGEYQGVAKQTMSSKHWNPDLRIWGTQMIERTALGDEYAIISPAKSTAVRINIHLHQQLFYDEPENILETDDEWVD